MHLFYERNRSHRKSNKFAQQHGSENMQPRRRGAPHECKSSEHVLSFF